MPRTAARVGLALAALYAVVALATTSWAPGRMRPLFDGFGSHPGEYHWVNPPAEFDERNRGHPGAAEKRIALGPDGSLEAESASPRDGQAQVTVVARSVPARSGDEAATLRLEPLDAGTLAPLPVGLRPEGNAYRATIVYEPSKTPLAEVTTPGLVGLMAAAPADILLFSPDGKAWEQLKATPLPQNAKGLTGSFTRTGYYVPASKNPPRAAAGSKKDDAGGGAVVAALVATGVIAAAAVTWLVLRRRRAAPAPPPPPSRPRTRKARENARKAAKRRR